GASTLSALSQISFVNTYFVIAYLLAFLQICLFLKEKDSEPSGRNSPLPILIALISSSLVLGLVYSPFVLGLMALPPYGGYDGFVKNTIASLGFDIFQRGSMNPIALSALVIGILLCILMALWGLIKSGSKGKYSTHHKFLFLTALLLIYISVLIKSEAIFIQILYPEGRTALYFLPLFFLFILLLPDNFNRLTGPLNKTANIAFYTLCSVIIFHGLCSINLNNFYIWEYDACTKKVLTFIGHEMKEHPKKKYTIGLNWVLEPSSNYYIIFWKMKQLKPASRKGPDGVYDFYYLLASDLDILKKYNLRVVKSYKLSGTFLAEPIH
ncbi:MAG: hypothetical protein KGJ11_08335, partial [Candidatus Omnitrophica bacterium]|nr:hypothetical protein [Candidatus Omnitrophota bacterium]